MKRLAFFLLCCFLRLCQLSAAEAFAAGPAQDLTLLDAKGKTLFSSAAPEGFVFGIRYTHSVALSPVEDWFAVSNGVIFLEKTVYSDFGAGLPHDPGPGQRMTREDGRMVISGYHTALPAFDVRVGRVAGHTLLLPKISGAASGTAGASGTASGPGGAICAGKTAEKICEVRLDALAAPGSAVTFTLRHKADFDVNGVE